LFVFFFFFQAEDGIRDDLVTGVQTCALPIYCCRGALSIDSVRSTQVPHARSGSLPARRPGLGRDSPCGGVGPGWALDPVAILQRSEERRVGKESSGRWWREQ